MPGWLTTDTAFEIWGTGFQEFAAHEGTQFVELNARIDGTLYQDSTGIQPGSVLEFTFAHRGRNGEDTMKLTITDLGADNSLEGEDDTVLFTKEYTTGKDAWVVYDSTTEQKIEALGNTVRFAYSAVAGTGGRGPDKTEGNFLDAANFGVGVVTAEPNAAGDTETNRLGMEFKLIPAGTFMMGSPESEERHHENEKQHEVTITRDYYLGITEVTQSQWQKVMGTTPWKGQKNVKEGKDNAASYISWNEAGEFCRKLSDQEGRTYRLPTEAEWEYACRGGTTTPYSFGDDASQLEQYAWHYGSKPSSASQVKQKRPNGFGLYDMLGNVFEFCQDWYGAYPQDSVTDPTGPSSGDSRVLRGGGFGSKGSAFRSASRNSHADLAAQHPVIGLRVVLVPGSDSGQLALDETPPENAMKLDVDGGAFAFGYRTTAEPGFTEFPNTDSPHPGITRRNRADGEYFSYAQNTRETEVIAQESSLVHYPAKAEGSGVLCPGQNPGDVAIARFTAMNDGEYHFKITAQLIEEDPTGAGVTIYVDSQAVEETQLHEHLVPWTTSSVVKLKKGQTVDIAVDSGVDQNWEKDHVLVTAKAWTTGPVNSDR